MLASMPQPLDGNTSYNLMIGAFRVLPITEAMTSTLLVLLSAQSALFRRQAEVRGDGSFGQEVGWRIRMQDEDQTRE